MNRPRPSHIAFFAHPGVGHVNPTLSTVAELVARGHRVSYALPAEMTGLLAGTGAIPVPYRSTMAGLRTSDPEPAPTDEADDRLSTGDVDRVLHGLLGETLATLPQLDRAFAGGRPDLVVHDNPSCWSGRLLAARWRTPVVGYRTTFAGNDSWSAASTGTDLDIGAPEMVRMYHGVGTLLRKLDVPLAPQDLIAGTGTEPALVFLPREFQYAGETFGSDFHFVGPCLDERGLDGSWVPDSGGRPLVLVSLGTIHNDRPEFFRDCVTAFADSPWHVVIATGDRVDPAGLGAVPSHIELRAHVPQQALLREAALFVSHAGMGSVMEALTHGVPIVAIPQMGEQRANADRVVELGLGTLLHRHRLTPDQLRSTVDATMHDPGIRARLAVMRERITATGGATAAADVIEHHLTHQDPR